jgi:hypothetical protein
MKVSEASRGHQPVSPRQAWLKVVVVYEDLITGARIRRMLARLLSRIGGEGDIRINMWSFDCLRDPALKARAADEAAADIVALSTHGGTDLPAEVKSWLGQWLANRADQPAALLVFVDRCRRESPGGKRLVRNLRPLAAAAGVDLIQSGGRPGESGNL